MKNPPEPRPLPRQLSAVAELGVMISNAFPDTRKTNGETYRATADVLARFPEFRAVQTVDIPFEDERRAMKARVADRGFVHTYMLTRALNERALSLSSLNSTEREAACALVIEKFSEAQQAGANIIGLISGAAPIEPPRRPAALRALEESLRTICTAATKVGGLMIEIEPLDYAAHKRATLGTTAEAVHLCQSLAAEGLRLALCLDTAHLLLNGEDILQAVEQARPCLLEFHFCNAITHPLHPLFGDRHLPFSVPGGIGAADLTTIMAGFVRAGYLGGASRPRISCEVLTPPGADPFALIAETNALLQASWERAR